MMKAGGFVDKGRPAKKYSQAGRVHDIIRLIEARHGVTMEELVEETGVNRRTIQRDLNVIEEAGYPLEAEWQDGVKIYRFLTRFKDVPPINFTLQELMTLSFLRSQTDFLKGTPFFDDMAAVFKKISSVLPARYAAHMERIAHVSRPLLHGARDYRRSSNQLQALREALLYQYRVSLLYDARSQGEPSRYEVEPYTLLFYKGGLYLLGYAVNRKALRTFAVERIRAVTMEKARFEIAADYQPQEQLHDAFGIVEEPAMAVVVRFSPQLAHTIRERIWHPSQTVATGADGSVTLSFTAGGRMEIISWVLSYGPHAEVLAPVDLRDAVARQTQEAAARYLDAGSPP